MEKHNGTQINTKETNAKEFSRIAENSQNFAYIDEEMPTVRFSYSASRFRIMNKQTILHLEEVFQ